ncbi:Solute carrier family 22 member 8, partial [Pseudolycoriella hygida]
HAKLYFGNEKYETTWDVRNVSRIGINIHKQHNIIPCDVFNIKSGKSITTYDIVCSRGGLVVLTQGMHLVGIFMSGIVARFLLKVVSPKGVLRMAMFLQIICGNIAGYVQSLTVHLVFRSLAAIGCAVAFVCDITSGKLKIAALIFFDIFWSIGIIILSIITQYESRWKELYVIISYPTLAILLLTLWIPDSPRWLLSHGDVESAFKIVVAAFKSCHKDEGLPSNLAFKLKVQSLRLMQQRQRSQTKWIELLQQSLKTTVGICAVHVAFACFTIMYFGMVLNMPNYGRRHLASSARFIASSEMVGCSIGYMFGTGTKRKFRWCGLFNILGAAIALCMWFWSPKEADFVEKGILLSFCLVLKASVSCSFGVLLAFSTDFVREDLRALLQFSSILCGRLLLLNAPVDVDQGS